MERKKPDVAIIDSIQTMFDEEIGSAPVSYTHLDPEDPTKVNIPYLKNKQGDILQPAFTDVMEFDKFARGKKLRAAKVPFAKLPGLIINQAKRCV